MDKRSPKLVSYELSGVAEVPEGIRPRDYGELIGGDHALRLHNIKVKLGSRVIIGSQEAEPVVVSVETPVVAPLVESEPEAPVLLTLGDFVQRAKELDGNEVLAYRSWNRLIREYQTSEEKRFGVTIDSTAARPVSSAMVDKSSLREYIDMLSERIFYRGYSRVLGKNFEPAIFDFWHAMTR